MINFKEYIVEKLRIHKDMETYQFHEGDKFSCLNFYFNNPWDEKVEIGINVPFTIKEITDDKLIYNTPFNDRDIELEYYINSKGYFQFDDKETSGKTLGRIFNYKIFIKPKEYKEILEMILKEKVFNPKYSEEGIKRVTDYLLKYYFDNVDEKELSKRKVVFYDHTHSSVVMPFTRPKEFKEVISKYYEEY